MQQTIPEHIWTRTHVRLVTSCRVQGVQKVYSSLVLPLEALGVRPNGLLHAVLRQAEAPLAHVQLKTFVRLLPRLVEEPQVLELLNRRPESCDQQTVRDLFRRFENVVERVHERGGRGVAGLALRHLFRHHPLPLGDGRLIRDSGFRTRFPPLAPRRDGALDDAPELKTLPFESLAERKELAHALLQQRKEDVLTLCRARFLKYRQVCEELARIEQVGLDGVPSRVTNSLLRGGCTTPETMKRLTEQQRLQVAVHLASQCNYVRVPPKVAVSRVPLSGISILGSLAAGYGYECQFEVLLARTYLPRTVVYACLCALVAETALNLHTLQGLRKSQVQRANESWYVHGLKAKTGQLQSRKVTAVAPEGHEDAYQVTSALAVEALTLLLAHAASLEQYTGTADPYLFSVLRVGDWVDYPRPAALVTANVKSVLVEQDPAWDFELAQLRRLAGQVHYTSPDGDIFSTSALLNHSDPKTTAEYLNDTVVRAMHASNLNRYVKMLAATILWVVDRPDSIPDGQECFVRPALLFPLQGAPASNRDSSVDQWIASGGAATLSIGIDEIHHLAIQASFYKKNTHLLASANPQAFLHFHLPRIVICAALRQVVQSSMHRAVLARFEEAVA